MTAQQRTLDDLKRGVNVQVDKAGKIRFGQQPMMDLPSVQIIDKSVVAQLEAELAGMKLMEAEAESFAEGIVAENEQYKDALQSIAGTNTKPSHLKKNWKEMMLAAKQRAKKALGGEK